MKVLLKFEIFQALISKVLKNSTIYNDKSNKETHNNYNN